MDHAIQTRVVLGQLYTLLKPFLCIVFLLAYNAYGLHYSFSFIVLSSVLPHYNGSSSAWHSTWLNMFVEWMNECMNEIELFKQNFVSNTCLFLIKKLNI